MRRTTLLVLILLVSGPLACGKKDLTGTETITLGPLTFAIPFLPSDANDVFVLGLKNLSSLDTLVDVTAFKPDGSTYAPGAVTLFVGERAELREPLSTFTGADPRTGGWLYVDTTAGPGVGFVYPYGCRQFLNGRESASLGGAFRATGGNVTLSPFANAYQIVNHTSVPVTYSIKMYDPFGTLTLDTLELIPADGSFLDPITPGTVGFVEVEPTAPPPGVAYLVAAHEDVISSFIEPRFFQTTGTKFEEFDIGIDIDYGKDEFGNVFDFGVLLSNTSTIDINVLISSLTDAAGNALLSAPQLVSLEAKETKFLSTTFARSEGLEIGETSPFQFLGDPAARSAGDAFWGTLTMFIPKEANATVRSYDSAFDSFFRVEWPLARSFQTNISDLPIQQTTTTGTRNIVSIMNPQSFPVTIFVRGATPVMGTEYILDQIGVGPFQRLDWSPDGLQFTEIIGDPSEPPVPYMSFTFSSGSAVHYGARKEQRNALDLILNIRPIIVRPLDFE